MRANTLTAVRRRSIRTALAVALLFALPAAGQQGWPSKPVRIVAAGSAGGTADITARLLADGLSAELGRPFIVDPKPGAAGAIAVNDLIAAPRDGYTVLVAVNSVVSEVPHIIRLKLDMAKELRPLVELARGGLVLVGTPSLPAGDFPALIAYARANPGKLSYASYSPGTMSHILGVQLARAAKIELTHIGYKGSTPALTDVMGGHVPLMFDGMPTALPLIRSGKIKAYAVSTPVRSPLLPQVPTFKELGYPQLEAVSWMGLWVTPDAPDAVQTRLREATLKVLAQPQMREKLREVGFDLGQPRTTAEMTRGLQADYQRVGKLLKEINFKPE